MASSSWKNFRLLQVLCRPLLLISLGLHGVLLWLPLTLETEVADAENPEEEKKETIKITRLAPPQPAPTQPSPTPEVSPSPPETLPKVASVSRSQPVRQQVSQQRVTPQLQTTPQKVLQTTPQPQVPPPSPTPSPSPVAPITPTPSPSPVASITPTPSPSPVAPITPTPSPSPVAPITPTPSPSPVAPPPLEEDFPTYQNAREGSGLKFLPPEIDRAVLHTQDPLDRVATFFEREIPSKGFNVAKVNESNSTARIYQVSISNKQPRYFHLFYLENRTLLMLLDRQVSLAKLEELKNSIDVLSPEDKLIEEIFARVYQEFDLKDFTISDLQSQDPDIPWVKERENYHFRGRLPVENPLDPNVEQHLQNRLFSLLEEQEFVKIGEEEQEGAKIFVFGNGSAYPTIGFAPVRINGQTTIGIVTTRNFFPPSFE
ncbi:MAG: hypothetical protein J7647_24250 [Cyanobacteria bacterium SBLK]|nr:hypothetical protein [Cyanobacteria bacterium SBLK]